MRDSPSRFTRANWGGGQPPKAGRHLPASWYFSGLVTLCFLIGFVGTQAWPHLKSVALWSETAIGAPQSNVPYA